MFLSEKNRSTTTVLHKKDSDEAPLRVDILLPTKRNRKKPFLSPKHRKVKIAIMLNELKVLTPTTLRTAKQVELCSERGKLLPKETAVITCPRPSDEIIKLVRDRRIEKIKSKVEIKKMIEV